MLPLRPEDQQTTSRTVSASAEPGPMDGTWTVTFHSQAVPGTLAVFAGTLSAAGLDIFSALVKRNADNTVTDSFDVAPLEGVEFTPADAGQLAVLAEKTLNGCDDLAGKIRAARRTHAGQPGPEPRIETHTESSVTTGISVVCSDRPGLLYDLASALSRYDLRTRSLSVLTFNGRAYDTFWVVDGSGAPPEDAALLARLCDDIRVLCTR